jgi:general secretion pathway protein A
MYNEFFGFSESPFKIIPNSRFYFPTASCEEALRTVRHAVETWKGVILVTGQPGTGKTLFFKSLARDMSSAVRAVTLYNPLTDLNGLLRLLLNRFDLQPASEDSGAMLDRLTAFLIEQRRDGGTVCLLIDEAQDLEPKALDELRLLSNLDFEDEALLPIVLLGQPDLEMKLDHPSAMRMKQRVALTRHTYPLIRMEIGPYIGFRLKVANYSSPDLFGQQALEKIAAYSGGIQRLVNAICDNSLMRAYAAKRKTIAPEIIDQVAREMRISAPLSLQRHPWPIGSSETRPPPAPSEDHAESVVQEAASSRAEERSEESNLLSNHGRGPARSQGSDSIASHQSRTEEVIDRTPNTETTGKSAGKTPLEPGRERLANAAGPVSYARRDAHRALSPRAFAWLVWPSIRRQRIKLGLHWYAVAAVIGLSVLVFGIMSSHSQLPAIYSAGAKRATIADTPSPQIVISAAPQSVEPDGSSAAPSPPDSGSVETATFHAPQAISSDAGMALTEVNGKHSQALDSAPRSLGRKDKARRAQSEDPPANNNGKKRQDSAATFKVVSASLVRNKPTDNAEIISTLEPGSRVTVLATSRDYYHVRSMDKKPIRGYVHREDAFFDRKQ